MKKKEITVALVGNPNVGKSTLFNGFTNMNQHTGNWPGKTVETAIGVYKYNGQTVNVVDLPGVYSLLTHSAEEEVTRDYIYFNKPDITIVVCNATCMERNLNLVLQTLEITKNVIVCINMIDEAEQKGIIIDKSGFENALGVKVIFSSARRKKGLEELKKAIYEFVPQEFQPVLHYNDNIEQKIEAVQALLNENNIDINTRWLALRIIENEADILSKLKLSKDTLNKIHIFVKKNNDDTISEQIINNIYKYSDEICKKYIYFSDKNYNIADRKIDKILTGKYTAIPIMVILLMLCFWITIVGANYPSAFLSEMFGKIQLWLGNTLIAAGVNETIKGLLVDGVFGVATWVVSVMLPPMAIFFPLFALLEDSGYLPRIAFNMDKCFHKCGACGKQSLTCAMGIGCNTVGVMGCRIIDSKRERLIAILTNSFMPCNGRLPTIIMIISMFIVSGVSGLWKSVFSSFTLMAVIALGVLATFMSSYVLSKTILKGEPSSFVMEMPSYRRPQFLRVVIRTFIDKTLKALVRAIIVAAPAGAVIWLLSNFTVGNVTMLKYITDALDPFARWFGLDGVIITAFVLGLPANEIVFPIILMAYMCNGTMVQMGDMNTIKEILTLNGWSITTAICTIVFSLMHWPCSTTLLTIKKETGSIKWTLWSIIIPTACGLILCFIINVALNVVLI